MSRLGTQNADGLAGISKHGRKINIPKVFPVVALPAVVGAVLENERSDALAFQPPREVMPFAVQPHVAIPAAGADHQAHAGGLCFRRLVNAVSGLGDETKNPVGPRQRGVGRAVRFDGFLDAIANRVLETCDRPKWLFFRQLSAKGGGAEAEHGQKRALRIHKGT